MERIKIAGIGVACLFACLGLSVINLAGFRGGFYQKLSQKNCIRLIPQFGCRGKILDRKGRVIVDNIITYELAIIPGQNDGLDESIAVASSLINKPGSVLLAEYKKNFLGPSLPVAVAKDISLKTAILAEESRFELPSLTVQAVPKRRYSYKKLGCHFIGYINEIDRWRLTKLEDYGYKTKDLVGFGGVEEKYDYYLRQEEGGQSIEVDRRGKFMRLLGFEQPKNGRDVQLTVDLDIQKIVEDKLEGKKGSVLVMDAETGEIIAMASFPSFNPAVFIDQDNSAIARLFQDPQAPFVNRAYCASFPAGSIFKVIVTTAGLETKKINPNTSFICTGSTLIGRGEFKCWNTHGQQDLNSAIAHSCNVFFYRSGLSIGPEMIREYALRFGLSASTGFELPYETTGFIPSLSWRKLKGLGKWYDGDTANLSIGQGDVLVTPLQIVRMIAVFANRGYLVTPYIVQSIDGKDISKYQRRLVKVGLRDSTIDVLRRGLRSVVTDPQGTGNVLATLNIPVSGKTGTAQAPPKAAHAWFCGYFPSNKPRYAICVLLEHGGPGFYATLVAKQIIEEMLRQDLI